MQKNQCRAPSANRQARIAQREPPSANRPAPCGRRLPAMAGGMGWTVLTKVSASCSINSMIEHSGEIAAFGTSVAWTIGPLLMERAVRRSGVMAVNTLKVLFATMYLALLAWMLNGSLFDARIAPTSFALLASSGIIGFVAGDYFLLHAYSLIGARLSVLLSSLSVPMTAIAAFVFLGEHPGLYGSAGIALCTVGVMYTVQSGKKNAQKAPATLPTDTPAVPGVDSASRELSARYRTGVVYGFLSALFTVCATFMTKAGSAGVGTVTATQIRIGSAFAGFTLFALATRKLPEVAAAVRDARGITVIAVASIFGPFIGVALLLYAIQHSNAGIAAALSSLSPVLILLPSRFLDKRRITAGEVGGALITTAGILLMFGIF